jgi:chemotaxis protein histidine kinase CheA
VSAWTDDPELLAIFRAEVDEKLATLRDGLLRLEGHSAPRQLVASLSREAHTVKGSARALSLEPVVLLAHRSEDLLGELRDGRQEIRRDLVDLLLAALDGISGAMPGAARPVTAAELDQLSAAFEAALNGVNPVDVPRPASGPVAPPPLTADPAEPTVPTGSATVRVPTRRVHDLLDLVGEAELEARRVERTLGELVALAREQARAAAAVRRSVDAGRAAEAAAELRALGELTEQLRGSADELRERVGDAGDRLVVVREAAMALAMVPVRRVTEKFPQLVREVARRGGKEVALVVDGADVELDARVLDGVADALTHLLTNAVDHGCEEPQTRVAAGKPAAATVRVAARAAGATVVVEVSDDGPGIDEEQLRRLAVERGLLPEGSSVTGQPLLSVLFTHGFSTVAEATEYSGRGVGLDVVRTAVEALGGSVEVVSQPGHGTTFVLTLPVTLGVLRCLVTRIGDERYALPVTNVIETVNLRDTPSQQVAGVSVIVRRGTPVPLADLGEVLDVPGQRQPDAAVVVRYGGPEEQFAWAVDVLEGERELVVKDLGGFLGRRPALGGATIDSDGRVLLLLDIRELALEQVANGRPAAVALPARPVPARAAATAGRPRVLVVEDSVGVRELQRVILEGAGYDVLTAVDGRDGATRLDGDPVDLVLSDVEMPGMDGFTLTRTIRRTHGWQDVPVVIMTSRGDEADKRAGLDAGASAYLLKSEFDQAELVSTVRRLIGR